MAATINTNITSINAQRNLSYSGQSLNTTMARLSSGLRVNSAKDDAAGMAIADRMNTQVRGLQVASRNANDGISLAQTAEGALGRIGDMLQRARELAVQAANTTNSAGDRKSLQAEVAQIIAEVDRVAKQTNFNGQKILDGSFAGAVFQVAAMSGDNVTVGSLADTRSAQIGNISYATNILAQDTRDTAGPPMQRAIEKFDEKIPAGTLKITVGTNDPVELEFLDPANSSLERMGQVITAINNKTADTGVIAYLTQQEGTQTYDIAIMSSKLDKKGDPLPVKFEGFTPETTGLADAGALQLKMYEAKAAATTEFKALTEKIDTYINALNKNTEITAAINSFKTSNPQLEKLIDEGLQSSKPLATALAAITDTSPMTEAQAKAVKTALDDIVAAAQKKVTDPSNSAYSSNYANIADSTAKDDIINAVDGIINSNATLKKLYDGTDGDALKAAVAALTPAAPPATGVTNSAAVKSALDALIIKANTQNETVAIPSTLTALLGKHTGDPAVDKTKIADAAKAVVDPMASGFDSTDSANKAYEAAYDALTDPAATADPATDKQLTTLASTAKTAKAKELLKADTTANAERKAYKDAVRDNDWTAAKAKAELNALNAYGKKLAKDITELRVSQLQAAYDAEAAKTGGTAPIVTDTNPRLQKYTFPTDYGTSTLEDGRREIARMEALLGITGVQIDNKEGTQWRTDQRGIDDVSVATQEGAWIALKKIDSALDQVNMARGTLGALQTRFENTVNNIDIQVENLSAARGRIIDADFAKETANLSRTQVLQQAGMAMVSQANQIPQQVLQLLKS